MPNLVDSTRRDSRGRAYAGSQRRIQTYVNEKTETLNFAVADSLSKYGLDAAKIEWVSPLESDCYREYQDSEFLNRIGLSHLAPQLQEFWPRGGPCWDALAQIVGGGCILVEAKSHVPEIYGGGCAAKSAKSKRQIEAALNSTKLWLGVPPDVNWIGPLYQSANRYATLYFLREIANVPAFLCNLYFVEDPRTRTTRQEWDAALGGVSRDLGLLREVPYSSAVFLKSE